MRNHGAAGRADRVGAEAVVEAHATVGDTVEVGRAVDAAAVATHGVRRVVVGHDEEDVWARVGHGKSFYYCVLRRVDEVVVYRRYLAFI